MTRQFLAPVKPKSVLDLVESRDAKNDAVEAASQQLLANLNSIKFFDVRYADECG